MSGLVTWAVPKFNYGQRVRVLPLKDPDGKPAEARVFDLHFFGQLKTVEYDVRYFHDGRDFRVRVFEDELESAE